MYKYEKIIQKIKKYKYISFDMFDTLIKRNIDYPQNIFFLVEQKYNELNKPKLKNFKDLRIKAELKAKSLIENKEPNIYDIYENIELDSKKYDINKLIKIEENLELEICQKNIDFYPIYLMAKKLNKKITITTDMYLSKNIITKILEKADIKFDFLFISNEVKCNKHYGSIYPYILKELNISNNEILHIGDSKRADFLIPRFNKISSLLIPKKIYKLNYIDIKNDKNSFNYTIYANFINNNLNLNKSKYYNIGYETLGIILLEYSKWLIEELKVNEIDKIFFLSREGKLLKKAFDLINDTNIESKYLYVSRRSTRVSTLKSLNNLDDILKVINLRKVSTLESFFENVGLDINNYEKLLKKYNYFKDDKINKLNNLDKLFLEIKKDIQENANKEETLLLKYLNQEKFYGKIAISDIGWKGTMQKTLESILDSNKIDNDIYGYYISAFNENKKTKGYIKDSTLINPCIHLLEKIFTANHGSTIKYQKEKNEIVPVLSSDSTENENKIFSEIQDGAIDFIQDVLEYKTIYNIELNELEAINGLFRLTLYPTNKDIKLFKSINYKDDVNSKLIIDKSFAYYLFHLKNFYYDFYLSGWKIGFLKNVFKIKLPYFKIYNLLKR